MKYTQVQSMRKQAGDSWLQRNVVTPIKETAQGIAADPKAFAKDVGKGAVAVGKNLPQFAYRSLEGGVDGILSTPAMVYSYGGGAVDYVQDPSKGFHTRPVPEVTAAPMQYTRNEFDKAFPEAGINKKLTINTGDATADKVMDFAAHTLIGGGLSYKGVVKGLNAVKNVKKLADSAKFTKTFPKVQQGVGMITAVPSMPANYTNAATGAL